MQFQREKLFEHEMIEEYKDGDSIFEEGDLGRDLYIVQEGAVRITKKTPTGEVELTRFKKGDFFGDMALLQSLPRYAGAAAVGDTRLLILKPAGFLLKVRRDPTFAFEMLQQLSWRVKTSSDILLQVVQKVNLPADELQRILASVGKDL